MSRSRLPNARYLGVKRSDHPEQMHRDLIKAVQELIPKKARVIVLGDGEFDGAQWLTGEANMKTLFISSATLERVRRPFTGMENVFV